MPFFRTPRASMAMPRAHANSAASERPSALSVGCSQPVFGRREHFHVLCLFNGLQAGKFPLPSFEGAPRADGGAAGACKSRGERRASAPSFGCSQPVLGRRENFHVLRLFNALRAGKIRVPFSEPRPAMPRAAVGGRGRDLARSRFREFARRRGRRRRPPKIACSRRECATSVHPPTSLATGRRRPTVVGGGGRGSRRIEAQRHE